MLSRKVSGCHRSEKGKRATISTCELGCVGNKCNQAVAVEQPAESGAAFTIPESAKDILFVAAILIAAIILAIIYYKFLAPKKAAK